MADAQTVVVANNGGFLWTTVNGVSIPIDHPTHTNEPPGFTGGWIESVDLDSGAVTRLYDSYEGRPLRGPNDLVFDAVGGLWFTDHGKGRFESVDRGALYYAPPGNGALKQVAFPLLGPNGVGLSPDGTTVYVAETHTGRLWAWDLLRPVKSGPQRAPWRCATVDGASWQHRSRSTRSRWRRMAASLSAPSVRGSSW